MLGGRLCGAASRPGKGGSGCGGCRLLAWVWFRVWVRAGLLVLSSYFMWFLRLCGLVLVMLLLVVVVLVLLLEVLLFGFRFGFGSGFGLGSRPWLRRNSSQRCEGTGDGWGGARGVLPGCLSCLCGGRGASGSLACGCFFGFGRGIVDEVGGEGGV